ncbi:histidine phosphatase family protein [Gammaproteobacteria bacterium LSUCC0112]|nr:histidine phosphatase family protein [Gammaproteobacteria bacterium LSUCC0112]
MKNSQPVQRIHLIRHGETNWNKEKRAQGQMESVLTQEGVAQATALRSTLKNSGICRVYCSSSVRTRQTADILFGDSPIPIIYCDQFREIHMGSWEGRLYSELQAAHPEQFYAFWNQPDAFNLPGAETFEEVQKRALQQLKLILEESPAMEIAIVSHGVLIKTLLCDTENRALSQLWQAPAMHNCARSIIDVYEDGTRRISLYSDQPYQS